MTPKLTRVMALGIVLKFINENKTNFEDFEKLGNKRVTFYESFRGVEGAVWLVEFSSEEESLSWIVHFVVSEKDERVVDILDKLGYSIIGYYEGIKADKTLLDGMKDALAKHDEGGILKALDEFQTDLLNYDISFEQGKNIDGLEELLAMCINYAVNNNEVGVVIDVLETIVFAQESQDCSNVNFELIENNIDLVEGRRLELYLEIMGNI